MGMARAVETDLSHNTTTILTSNNMTTANEEIMEDTRMAADTHSTHKEIAGGIEWNATWFSPDWIEAAPGPHIIGERGLLLTSLSQFKMVVATSLAPLRQKLQQVCNQTRSWNCHKANKITSVIHALITRVTRNFSSTINEANMVQLEQEFFPGMGEAAPAIDLEEELDFLSDMAASKFEHWRWHDLRLWDSITGRLNTLGFFPLTQFTTFSVVGKIGDFILVQLSIPFTLEQPQTVEVLSTSMIVHDLDQDRFFKVNRDHKDRKITFTPDTLLEVNLNQCYEDRDDQQTPRFFCPGGADTLPMELGAFFQTWERGSLALEEVTSEDLNQFHLDWPTYWLTGFVEPSQLKLSCRTQDQQQLDTVLIEKRHPARDGFGILRLNLPPGYTCLAEVTSHFDTSAWMVSTQLFQADDRIMQLPPSYGWQIETTTTMVTGLSGEQFGQALLILVSALIIVAAILFLSYDYYVHRTCCHIVRHQNREVRETSGPQPDFQPCSAAEAGLPMVPIRANRPGTQPCQPRTPPNTPVTGVRESPALATGAAQLMVDPPTPAN